MAGDFDEDITTEHHSLKFTYLSIWEHTQNIVKFWKTGTLSFIGIFSGLWLFFEPLSLFPNFDFRSKYAYPTLISVSALSGLTLMLIKYLHHTPKGYENESREIQNIVRLKRPLWEFRAMRLMLEERIGHQDRRLDDLANKKSFVEKTSMDVLEYTNWISDRPDNMLEMAEVAKKVLVFEFPKYLNRGGSMDDKAKDLLLGAEFISNFYKDISDFEMKSYSVKPPERLERAHEIQSEWTLIIRNGVKQMLVF